MSELESSLKVSSFLSRPNNTFSSMEIEFRSRNPKQIEAAEAWLDDRIEEILYGGAKGGGKSFLGASLIFGDALIYPETHYFIARQELIDLRKFTVPTVQEVFQGWKLDINKYAVLNHQDNVWNLYNGSKVFMISCRETPSDPLFERFGSMQMTRGWIEEGGEIAAAAKANLALSIGRWKNDKYNLKRKLLITANPKKGWMKRDYVDLAKLGQLPSNRKYIQAFPTDNVYLPKDYIKALASEKDTVRRQRLYEGVWDYDEDKDSIVSADALEDAFGATITKDGDKYMVVDVARFGEDSTVISLWDGLDCYKITKYQKQDTEETKQKIKDTAAKEKVPWSHIIVDEDGVGGGVVDGLPGVRGFVANSSPLPTADEIRRKHQGIENEMIPKRNFSNLKSQCGYKMAELINEHKVSFTVPDLRDTIISELSAILREKEVDSDKKLTLKPKDEVKEIIGHSPDVGDTFLMRAWFELRKIAINEDPHQEKVIRMRQQERFQQNANAPRSNQ